MSLHKVTISAFHFQSASVRPGTRSFLLFPQCVVSALRFLLLCKVDKILCRPRNQSEAFPQILAVFSISPKIGGTQKKNLWFIIIFTSKHSNFGGVSVWDQPKTPSPGCQCSLPRSPGFPFQALACQALGWVDGWIVGLMVFCWLLKTLWNCETLIFASQLSWFMWNSFL